MVRPFIVALVTALPLAAQSAPRPALNALPLGAAAPAPAPVSAAIVDVRYVVTFMRATAAAGSFEVAMTFRTAAPGTVLLSLPAWTPGAYEIGDFAKYVSGFEATQGGEAARWDKLDPDTWRIRALRTGEMTVRYMVQADQLDNAKAWSRPDFLFFNGTNAFLYPEGRSAAFPAKVVVETEADWKVATGMPGDGAPRRYREANYHDLVDHPVFVGAFDLDSADVDGVKHRLASYPVGALAGAGRAQFWAELGKSVPAMRKVFGVTPWTDYTTLTVFVPFDGGGSALEHMASHLGIYDPQFIGTDVLASITAHEIFHAWNVKRLRPADLVPYRYAAPQPTPWLWVSEGITDYYADLALVRGGIIDVDGFLATTSGKIANVASVPPVALEDASLQIWIHPTDGTDAIYYPKGSLAGMLLDVMIRDASDGARSLDDVMASLYRGTYLRGLGFTSAQWWGAVRAAAGTGSFAEFMDRYIDGRDPFPYAEVLAKVGVRVAMDSTRLPRMGVQLATDTVSGAQTIVAVTPGGAFAQAGVEAGDVLLRVGEVEAVPGQDLGQAFRSRYASAAEGTALRVVVRRGGAERTLEARLAFAVTVSERLAIDPGANARAVRLRNGWLGQK